MRKVILYMMESLDGFIARPNGELDWLLIHEESEKYANDLLSTVDTILVGHVTYQQMANYWPSVPTNPSSTESEIEFAHKMNSIPNCVFKDSGEG
jgi:dihydrofolate reductase